MNGNISENREPIAGAPGSLATLRVAGITPFTTIDFPGRLAGVFYLQGCPWRCRYCYNSEFWPSHETLPPERRVPHAEVLGFLNSRKGHLDGIVLSGGEPLVHPELPEWMRSLRDLGFEVGLHTAGMFPDRLERVLGLCDWIGLDIKAPFESYEKITGANESGLKARESAKKILAKDSIAYEFRTTFHPDLLGEDDILRIATELAAMGCQHYALQMFRPEHCPDKALREHAVPGSGISAGLRKDLQNLFPDFRVRE